MGTNGSTGVERKEIEKEGFEERNPWKNSSGLPSELVVTCSALTSCFKGEAAMLIHVFLEYIC